MAFQRDRPPVYQALDLMKLTITKKLFFTVILVTAAVIGMISFLMKESIGSGFGRYLAQVELRKVETVARRMETLYGRNGNWEFLDSDPDFVWHEMQRAMVPPNDQAANGQMVGNFPHHFSPEDFGKPSTVPHPPDVNRHRQYPLFHPLGIPPHIMELLHRVAIFNSDKNRIWGIPSASLNLASLPLTSNGKQIGYLALAPGPSLYSEIEASFVEEQNRNLVLIAFFGFLIATMASMALSKHLLSGIKALSKGTHRLATSDFSVRLDASSSDEIGQLAKDFNYLAQALQEQDEKSKQWVSDTSHELRTPIAILRAQVEAFQDGVQEINAKTLGVLHKEVMSLSKLVDDLYWLARFDVGKLTDKLMPMDLTACIQDVVLAFEERLKDRNISIDTSDLYEGDLVIAADSNRIKQVLINLLENSMRYTDTGGMVKITTEKADGKVVISCEDSAPAVPDALLAQIFERFFRVESSRSRDFGGAGLGLAICKSIVEAHGGTIVASHSMLGGLKITIELPQVGGPVNA